MTDLEEPQSIEGSFVMEEADFRTFQHHLNTRKRARLGRWFSLGVIALAAIGYVWIISTGGDRDNPLLVVAISFLVVLYVLVPWMQKRSWKRNALFNRQVQFTALPDRIELQWGNASTSATSWSDIAQVEQSTEHFYLWIDKAHAIVLPLRAFASPAQVQAFAAMAHQRKTLIGQHDT